MDVEARDDEDGAGSSRRTTLMDPGVLDLLSSLGISDTAAAGGGDADDTTNFRLPPPAPPPGFVTNPFSYDLDDHGSNKSDSTVRKHQEEYGFGVGRDHNSNPFFDLNDFHQDHNQYQRIYPHSSSSSTSVPDDVHVLHRRQLPLPRHVQLCRNGAPFFSVDDDYDSSPDSASSSSPKTLPEFTGSGGGKGFFKTPLRAAIHPNRPPSLELRPHPLRETQAGSFLRTIACTPSSQLWAGQESGVRVWDLGEVFAGREEIERAPKGDEESAPFQVSCWIPPTLCLAVDAANQLVWSGHKDGKIRAWQMDQPKRQTSYASSESVSDTTDFDSGVAAAATPRFKEAFSWQAHLRAPVLSMVFTSYGDMWSGSEGGVIKVWPWEAIEKALSLPIEKRHVAAVKVERSYVDLRNQVTVGGACSLPSADVKFLLSDNSRSRVWSCTSLSFALWNSRTKELLKVFGTDGQFETRADVPSGHELYVEEEMRLKFVSASKKEKSQGPMSFFQRSRNALMGAADAVRRVATMGAFGDDNRRTEAMAISMDGMIWTGCASGALVQWDGNGNRLQEIQHHSSSVQCLCTFGTRLWVGYVSGTVQVLDLEGNLLKGWVAHSSPVINMAVGGGYVFTLANHGGIRGWSLTSPGPLDEILKSELLNKELLFTRLENIKILVGTWNVGQERASHDSLISWVGCSASEADVVVVGLQEVEMGAGFLAMAAAKETVGLEGSANGHWWLETIGKTLDEGTTFERVGSRQLAGLLISIWSRKSIRKRIGDVDVGAVPCGFGRAIGNKGSVGLKMRVFDRIFCFMNCHFAAHLEAVSRRNADFDHVYRAMSFSRPSNVHHSSGGGSSYAVQSLRGSNVTGSSPEDGRPELSEADMVVFFGDLNYRLHGVSYDDARESVTQRSFDWLREKDQLRAEMKAGKVFQGMREGFIRFPPTYKFERHQIGLSAYDSGEKKRIPAWCDRILYRDNCSTPEEESSLQCPVASSILQYDACMDVTDSDHKPVRCLFNVDIARVDELVRRQEFGKILSSNKKIKSLLEELTNVPETIVSTNNLILQNHDTSILRITNKCERHNALYEISCEGQSSIKDDGLASELRPRGAFGFPHWLEVTPAAGIIRPGQIIEVSLHHEEFQTFTEFVDGSPQNSWCEDTTDKEVIMVVNVSGNFSAERRSHRIRVCRCISSKNASNDSKSSSTAVQSNLLYRADFHQFGSSTDPGDLRCLR